jgi:Isochorismatase family
MNHTPLNEKNLNLTKQMHPTAPFIHRQGEVDAWDNADFRAAVQATGKNQIILAGIVTEVCKLVFVLLSSLSNSNTPNQAHPSSLFLSATPATMYGPTRTPAVHSPISSLRMLIGVWRRRVCISWGCLG